MEYITYRQALQRKWQLDYNGLHLWYVPLFKNEEDKKNLSSNEILYSSKFKFLKDQNKFLCRRAYLRKIISLYLKIPPGEIILKYNDFGKPSIVTEQNNLSLQFNISFSKELGLIGITIRNLIGVDIELIGRIYNLECIIQEYFAQDEYLFLNQVDDKDRLRYFYHLWTCKEAYLKALGVGLSEDLNKFSINFAKNGKIELNDFGMIIGRPQSWNIKTSLFTVNSDYYTVSTAINCENVVVSKYFISDRIPDNLEVSYNE